MEKATNNNINVDTIVADIKMQANQKKNKLSKANLLQKTQKKINFLIKIYNYVFIKDLEIQYELKELLAYEDEDFINNVYRLLLNREPDLDGLTANLNQLRSGKVSKVEIIARLIFSPEGEYQKLKVRGLIPHLLINASYKIPVVGHFFKITSIVYRLPDIIYKIQSYQRSMGNQNKSYYQPDSAIDLEDHSLDQLYLEFENRFRGTKEEISARQIKYIQYIKDLDLKADDLVVDLGCGRGEWLKLLKDNGIKSMGVDSNLYMVKTCLKNKLDVVNEEVISFLENTTSNSYMALTGFHIAEHIPFASLIKLIDLSLDALKPGGIFILETPNPENLIIGACNFYTDPSHLNPIPPHALQFFVQSRGFTDVQIFSPHTKTVKIKDTHLNEFYNRWINKYPDYAVIAKKPSV